MPYPPELRPLHLRLLRHRDANQTDSYGFLGQVNLLGRLMEQIRYVHRFSRVCCECFIYIVYHEMLTLIIEHTIFMLWCYQGCLNNLQKTYLIIFIIATICMNIYWRYHTASMSSLYKYTVLSMKRCPVHQPVSRPTRITSHVKSSWPHICIQCLSMVWLRYT